MLLVKNDNFQIVQAAMKGKVCIRAKWPIKPALGQFLYTA